MFFTQLGLSPSATRKWIKATSFAPLPEEFVNVLFGDAEHFCNLLISAKLLINCINDLLAQFYGICFHTP